MRVFKLVLPGQPTGSAGLHQVITFSIFSLIRPDFNSELAGFQINLLNRVEFHNYEKHIIIVLDKLFFKKKEKKKKFG